MTARNSAQAVRPCMTTATTTCETRRRSSSSLRKRVLFGLSTAIISTVLLHALTPATSLAAVNSGRTYTLTPWHQQATDGRHWMGDDLTVQHIPHEESPLLRVSTTTGGKILDKTADSADSADSASSISSSSFSSSSPNITTLFLPIPNEEGSLASTLWPASCAASLWLARYGPALFAASCEDTPGNTGNNRANLRIVELGSGLGLTGWMAAATAAASTDNPTVVLTDHDDEAVTRLSTSPDVNPDLAHTTTVQARRLEWRDDHAAMEHDERFDVVVGSDVAYYSFLLGPLRETVQHMQPHTFICAGPTHRTSLWDLYRATSQGDAYNSKTDRREDAWPGMTRLLLYRLHHHSMMPGDPTQDKVEHEDMGVYVWTRHAGVEKQLRDWLEAGEMYAATDKDKEGMETSF